MVRPSTPKDAHALVEFHERLSSRTVYMRFFSAHSSLTDEEIRRFTEGEGRDYLTLVAERDGAVVGVGRYDRLSDPHAAEVGLVVADTWQHRGIGTFLFRALAEEARDRAIRELIANVLPPNTRAIEGLAASKRAAVKWLENGTIEVRIDITAERAPTRGPRPDPEAERRQ